MSRENVEKLRKEGDIWMTGNLGDLSLLDAEVVYEDTMVPDTLISERARSRTTSPTGTPLRPSKLPGYGSNSHVGGNVVGRRPRPR
jgi:hypothetical protein